MGQHFDRNKVKELVSTGRLTDFQREKIVQLEGQAWLDAIEREVAYKTPARPTPDLNTLHKQIKAQAAQMARMVKDATEAAEAEAVGYVMRLADNLQLSENAVMELIKRYSITEVTSILETLNNQKAMKGYMVADSFFGTRTTRIEARDIEQLIRNKQAHSDRDSFFS